MRINKIFYTLEDIKKQITIIPIIFIVIIAIISLVIATLFVNKELNKELEFIKQQDTYYKNKVLNSYISDIKYNASAIFDIEEINLRKYINQIKGYLYGKYQQQQLDIDDIKAYLKQMEQQSGLTLVVCNIDDYEVLYGQAVISYLQTLSNSQLKTKTFKKYIVKNIIALGDENIQYWMDKQHRSLRLSYFEEIENLGWFVGGFSKLDNIKNETKRAIFESILTKSKVINGHFWFYDYLNNIVFNYYNKARAFDLEDILKDNQDDEKILNLYYRHPDLLSNSIDSIHNFTKFNFLVTVKTNSLEPKIAQLNKEFRYKLIKIYAMVIILSLVLGAFLRLFTKFITKIFTRYNRRLQLRSDMFKRWKERYELAIIASNDGFWDINLKENKIYFSDKWLEMFGYAKDEIITLEDWLDLIHFEDKELVQDTLERHINGQHKNFICEYRIRNKFNVYKWVLVRGKVFKDHRGRPIRMLMTSMDINDSKQISKELQDVQLLVDVGRIVIFKWKNDAQLTIDYVSKSINSYGYTKQKFENHMLGYYEFVYDEDVPKLQQKIAQTIDEQKNSFSMVYRVLESNGTIKWVYNRTIFIKDHFGKITHLYGYINDITQMKLNEEELKLRVDYEAQKNIEKDRLLVQQNKLASMGEMLGSIAHQWRQPLNNISLLIHFIRDNFKNEAFKQKDMDDNIASIKFQIDYMSQTIDDFRNFYQPNKDKVHFNIKQTIKKSYKIVQTQYEKEKIKITIAGDDVELFSYESEFQQVIVNILNNAKDAAIEKQKKEAFHPQVDIKVRQVNQKVVIEIFNNCGTLSNKILSRIFEPYFTTKFENQGTGIGLFMCKTIIEKNMNGVIGAKNVENGLNFSIILPI